MRQTITALVGAVLASVLSPGRAFAFSYFEHKAIGDAVCAMLAQADGAQVACEKRFQSGYDAPPVTVTFGDLVALAGDHFEKPEDLLAALAGLSRADQGDPARQGAAIVRAALTARDFQWRGVSTWLRQTDQGMPACLALRQNDAELLWKMDHPVRECLREIEQRVASLRRGIDIARGSNRGRPSCYSGTADEDGLFDSVPQYLTLASGNIRHFGIAASATAARYGIRARQHGVATTDEIPFTDPRVVELAFGLHFLTDRFAAGHIRTRREQLSARESKRRHDFDNRYGLLVAMSSVDQVLNLVSPTRLTVTTPRVFQEGAFDRAVGSQRYVWRAFGDDCLLASEAGDAFAIVSHVSLNFVRKGLGMAGIDPSEAQKLDLGVPQLFRTYAQTDEVEEERLEIERWSELARADADEPFGQRLRRSLGFRITGVERGDDAEDRENPEVLTDPRIAVVTLEGVTGAFRGGGQWGWLEGLALRLEFPSLLGGLVVASGAYQATTRTTALVPIKLANASRRAPGLNAVNIEFGWVALRQAGETGADGASTGFQHGFDLHYFLRYELPRGMAFALGAEGFFLARKENYFKGLIVGLSFMADIN